jgi:hypothetical protein
MSKICPNCLRPVRTGANYCGFCGASLIPATRGVSTAAPSIALNNTVADVRSTTNAQPNPKRSKARRPWVITPIILLFLVILLALIVRFWPEITAYLGQIVSSIRLP